MSNIDNVETIKNLADNLPNTKQKFGLFRSFLLISMCVFLHFLSYEGVQKVLGDHFNLSAIIVPNNESNEESYTEETTTQEEVSGTSERDKDLTTAYKVTKKHTQLFDKIDSDSPKKEYRVGDIVIQFSDPIDSGSDTSQWIYVKDYSGDTGWITADNLKKLDGDKIIELTVNATSSYKTKKTNEVKKPEYAIDGYMDTSWQEGSKGIGKGESIHLNFTGEEQVTKLIIVNGNVLSKKKYLENNRLKKAVLRFSDGNQQEITFEDNYSLDGTKVTFHSPITTEWIEIVIDEVYKGSKCNDTCISEILVFR